MVDPEATVEEVRRQLYQDARSSRDESVSMYENLAVTARAAGRLEDASRYQERANQERTRPLPNAA